ncbi:hypothetical protein BLNAU_2990 [Blattamonas nauphoetae]|uniref:Uncharacterized protein n=1 Tax=Blattamonas nauphoetae TaxID=2049346 RepID=A0ABQ9YDT9_9EUKA|nr:hypothetical protein BLNAU_2990 [Blattamonas nauphoetae]
MGGQNNRSIPSSESSPRSAGRQAIAAKREGNDKLLPVTDVTKLDDTAVDSFVDSHPRLFQETTTRCQAQMIKITAAPPITFNRLHDLSIKLEPPSFSPSKASSRKAWLQHLCSDGHSSAPNQYSFRV